MEIRAEKNTGKRIRYYRVKHKIEAGVLKGLNDGKGVSDKSELLRRWIFHWWEYIYAVELFGSESRERLIGNNRYLRCALHKKGIKYEDCLYASVESVNGLYSLKGFYRLKSRLSYEDLVCAVREQWCRKRDEHEAMVIDFDSVTEVWEYVKDNMLKGVLEVDYSHKHLVVSKGW